MMNHTRRVFVCLLGLVVILSILVFPVSAQGNDSSAVNNTENETITYETPTSSYSSQQNGYDLFIESQRNFDRSLSILNNINTSIQTFIEILAVVIAIVGLLGLFEIKKWHSIREDIEKYKITIEKDAQVLREIKIKAEKDAETIRTEVKNIPQDISFQKPTDEVLRKLDDFSRHVETLELLGATLKPEDYLNRGNDLFYKNEYNSALKAYEKAIELKPDYVEAWSNKGVTLGDLGRHEEELEAADKAIKLKPDSVEPWSNKSAVLGELGRHEESLEAADKAIGLKPDFAKAWYNKAISLVKLDRHEEGLEAFDKTIELEPDFANTWFNRACVQSLLGNKKKALSDLEKAIELDAYNKEKAKTDEDFKDLWDDEEFKNLVK